ncbi:hypothetical protein [Pseudomonas sp. PDM13]|uniref:hypothetical protein n=1 Tax=Pseudomonas sp. PDM13 TaxID=2769255 RepID=UPI0021E0BEF1|nr:hypothetical protein [Pseudomonas sp. PDM13]MCU9950597.1 hypothetical protein [Pseudomonas sp. PDM13]
MNVAEAFRVGEEMNIGRQNDIAAVDTAGPIDLEPDIRRNGGRSICQGYAADLSVLMAVGIFLGRGCIASADRNDTRVGQALQFTRITDAVAVQIAPHLQRRIRGVIGVDQSIAVIVVFGQCLEAILGSLAIVEDAVVAKQLCAIADAPIPIAIMYEQSIIRTDPTASFTQAIIVQVEIGRAHFLGLDPVTVQVDDDRRGSGFAFIGVGDFFLFFLLFWLGFEIDAQITILELVDRETTIYNQRGTVQDIDVSAPLILILWVVLLPLPPCKEFIT